MKNESGQALVTFLIFVVTAILITSAAVIMSIANTQSTSIYAGGERAYEAAEAGAENTLLMLLRNPSYGSSAVVLPVGNDQATVQVSTSGTTKTVTSEGSAVSGHYKRTIQVQVNYSTTMTITSWQEI
jgi:hypothetical protein